MDISYALTPFFAWLMAGSLKFLINSARAGNLAFSQVGYGGLPSNHSAIVTSMAALIALREGIDTPLFGIAVTLAFIVMMDANSLRRQIGKQAQAINQLQQDDQQPSLRERMGHTRIEIIAGIATGIIAALLVNSTVDFLH